MGESCKSFYKNIILASLEGLVYYFLSTFDKAKSSLVFSFYFEFLLLRLYFGFCFYQDLQHFEKFVL